MLYSLIGIFVASSFVGAGIWIVRNKSGADPITNNSLVTTPTIEENQDSQSEPQLSTISSNSPLATTPIAASPAISNIHWIILAIDGAIAAGLFIALVLRIITKIFSQPGMAQEPNKNGPVTVDQLNVDIPV